jgi:hypothetical protein
MASGLQIIYVHVFVTAWERRNREFGVIYISFRLYVPSHMFDLPVAIIYVNEVFDVYMYDSQIVLNHLYW